jgi:hypothetical protein
VVEQAPEAEMTSLSAESSELMAAALIAREKTFVPGY